MPDFHVFYCRHRTGDGIAPYAPAPIQADRIPVLAHQVLEENGDCFGLVDDDDSVLQFIYLARGEGDERPILMEIPNMCRRGNLTRYISSAELFELLKNLPERLSTDVIMNGGVAAGRP